MCGPTEELLAPPTKLDELNELPVPVGRRGVVELEVGLGTENCPMEELAPPEILEYPELKGPTVEDTGDTWPLARLDDVG